jgi:hypothetical protein
MRRQQKIAITILLFLGAFLALGDRYFSPPINKAISRDEAPVYGIFQILIPGGLEQLGRFCNAPENIQNDWLRKYYCDIRLTDRYLAFFTFCLAVATIGLGAISVAGIWRQSKETRVLQRAYLNILPRGIEPLVSTETYLSVDVLFVNSGNLPASRVSWKIRRCLNRDDSFKPPPLTVNEQTTNIVAARGRIRKGGPFLETKEFETFRAATKPNEFCWLYVWGRVCYHDGFQADRWIEFCHRYNLAGTEKFGLIISPAHGRQHELGNRTDES